MPYKTTPLSNQTEYMDNRNLFYQESGKTNTLGLFLSYLLCGLIALFLGYAYSVIIIFSPFIYINFLVTIGLGLTLGFIIKFLVRITHNRNRRRKLILAIVFGLLTNYFQWTVYILYALSGKIPSFSYYLANLHWIAVPMNFIDAIAEIHRIGDWSIFGITFTGFELTSIWIIEAFIIIAVPVAAIYKTKIYPFSEFLNKWYPKYTLLKDFKSVSTINRMISDLQKDPLKSIQDLDYGSGLRYTKIHLFYLKDEKNQYLTFENIFIEGRGKGKKNREVIINNFKIDKISAELLLENFENKRERTEVI